MSTRRWLLLAVVVAVAFFAAYVVGQDDGDDSAPSDPQLDLEALPAGARELVSLAAAGTDGQRHARYEGSDGSRLEVWSDGERTREEMTPADGPRQLVVADGERSTRCEEADDGWDCGDPVDAPAGLGGRVDQLLLDLEGATVAASDDTIAGLPVRCFDVASGEGEVSICLAQDGVVARLVAGSTSLELTEVDDDQPADGYEAPG